MFNCHLASQMKEINNRLQKIMEEKEAFDLNVNSRTSTNQVGNQRPLTTSLNEPRIYGRENDKEAIVKLLLKDEKANANYSVISIQGMGGLGKTTLAQIVYNDARVKAHFDVTAWTCVSDYFNLQYLTKTILLGVGGEAGDISDLNLLQVKLKEQLSRKKFLIVLDDVWEESYEKWTKLCLPLQAASCGSKIIVTTRNMSVSVMVGALPPYLLRGLSHDYCLSIFAFHSLGRMNFDERQDLKVIADRIVQRCSGLPLAAKALGGPLRGKTNSKDWNEVLQSNLWNLSEDKSGIIPALQVSYHCLPSHLKKCFAYCSIFPKDYEFHKWKLILLWRAEGFLETRRPPDKLREELGEEYFDDLLSRSFFQQSSDDTRKFVMHDLINDLARWATKDTCLRIDNLQECWKQWKISKNLRYLSCANSISDYASIQNFIPFNEMKRLRTFISLPSDLWKADVCDFPFALLQLQYLKVLSLDRYPISLLPEKVGDLKLLHHIDLSHTLVKFLPDSINRLYNLEVLLLKGCSEFERFCPDMGNLIKLRLLYVTDAPKMELERMPLRIGQSTFQRQGCLQEPLENKKGVRNLRLEWTCRSDDLSKKLFHKLQGLQIAGYDYVQCQTWFQDSFSSLVSLKLEHCASLPSLGQLPSLKKLAITNVYGLKSLGLDFYGSNNSKPFPCLEQLHISNMLEWVEWISDDSGRDVIAFPLLRELSISYCSRLRGKLPRHFQTN